MPEPLTVPPRRLGLVVFLLIGLALDAAVIGFYVRMPVVPWVLLLLLAAAFTWAPLHFLIRPKPFATFRATGLAFPFLNIPEIPWSRIDDAQVGPRSLARGRETTVFFQFALVLKLTSGASAAPSLFGRSATVATSDGAEECLIDMSYSSMRTPEFIAVIGRWRPAAGARHLADATNAFTPSAAARKQNRRAGVVILVFGAIFATVGGWVGVQTLRPRAWPQTKGVVVSSTMTSSRGRHGTQYRPVIVYRYTVDGHEYTGRRFAITSASGAAAVGAIVERYPVGATATVFYDPADPSAAVLEQSAFTLPGVLLAIGVLLAAAGTFLMRLA